MLLFIAKSF